MLPISLSSVRTQDLTYATFFSCWLWQCLLFLSQPSQQQSGFSLKKVKINGLSFFTTEKEMRAKWGNEDSTSTAAIYDDMGCYAQSKGKEVIPATWFFFPGLQYVSTAGRNVQFYSIDYTNARMSKVIISLPGLNVTAGTNKAQVINAYPKARVMDASTGYNLPAGEVDVAIDTFNPDTGEALIFEFQNGKLKRVYHWFDCT